MALSGTRSFNPNLGEVIIAAFARCGVRRTELTQQHMADAQFEGNLLQSDMQGDGINLYQVVLQTQDIIPGKGQYFIDPTTVFMLDVYIRQNNYSNVPIGVGWANNYPYVDGWTNSNGSQMIWYNTPPTSAPNPTSVDWANQYQYDSPWVNSNDKVDYWAYSPPLNYVQWGNNQSNYPIPWTNDNGYTDNWMGIGSPIPPEPIPPIPPGPVYSLNSGVTDRLITPISRSDWAATANKGMTGFPTSYWYDKLLEPVMYLWPVPNMFIPQGLQYYIQQRPQNADMANGTDIQIPYEYYDYYCWGLAERLAYIYAPEKVAIISPRKEKAWLRALQANTENVPLNLDTNLGSYFRIG